MKMKTPLLVTALVLASTNVLTAQASIVNYNIAAEFTEPTAAGGNTTFHGSFAWDTATQSISGLQGTMNSSMVDPQPTPAEDILLTGTFTQSASGAYTVASVYKNTSTSIFKPASATETQVGQFVFRNSNGIDVSKQIDVGVTQNAFFTFAFDSSNPTLSNLSLMSYADCTANGMMMQICMTGHEGTPAYPADGTMGATPLSLTISAVPVPAAAWLFGTALTGLGLVRRRKSALAA
ncbi:MAG: VPLPA-CTERM sorting domain-containing protein [Methylococcales bacterium]